jgi:hypothetical protein
VVGEGSQLDSGYLLICVDGTPSVFVFHEFLLLFEELDTFFVAEGSVLVLGVNLFYIP